MKHLLLLLPIVVLAASACRQPEPEASPTPLPELAVGPEVVATEASPLPTASPGTAPSPQATSPTTRTGPTTPPPPANEPNTAPPPRDEDQGEPRQARSFGTILALEDRAGDEGLEAPSYADLRQITLQDDGERLRVWVDVGAELPRTLNEGEVIGLGVDLYLGDGDDSDYQLFVDGGSDGWHAYFQTPRGFVPYPGTFAIGGRRLEFVVPWSAMGTPSRGELRVFLDWSQARPLLNAIGADYAPDRGRRAWAR